MNINLAQDFLNANLDPNKPVYIATISVAKSGLSRKWKFYQVKGEAIVDLTWAFCALSGRSHGDATAYSVKGVGVDPTMVVNNIFHLMADAGFTQYAGVYPHIVEM